MLIHRHATIIAVIVVAAVVFAIERATDAPISDSYGAVPIAIADATRQLRVGHGSWEVGRELLTLFTAIFVHADPEHIVYNMVFFWTFGYLVSETLGQWTALAIFLLCGICGNIVQVCLNVSYAGSIVGASGGISGLAGAYLGLALCWHLQWADVWPIAYPIPPMQLGAFAVLGFLGDLYLFTSHDQKIAYGAHIGGFLCGFAIAAIIATVYPTVERFNRAWRKR